jgi:hypothetical protein
VLTNDKPKDTTAPRETKWISVAPTEIISGAVLGGRIWDHRPMANRRYPPADDAHDILAAEEFGVPAPDPALHRDEARDVLAAEEFGMPAPDPAIGHGPVTLPGDPTGIAEPHDVLAAEEFAMPAGRVHGARDVSGPGGRGRAVVGAGAAVAFAALLLRKRHR